MSVRRTGLAFLGAGVTAWLLTAAGAGVYGAWVCRQAPLGSVIVVLLFGWPFALLAGATAYLPYRLLQRRLRVTRRAAVCVGGVDGSARQAAG